MGYLVVDLEVGVNNTGPGAIGKHSASPWCDRNYVVAAGYASSSGERRLTYNREGVRTFQIPAGDDFAVGHNIKFDLHYLRRFSPAWAEWMRTGRVWDTMLAEYLLSGQYVKFPSLDYCAERYQGTLKDTLISAYWEQGVRTEDIPKEQLCEYLKNDVLNTELVYLAQRQRAADLGMERLISANMEALLATADMEWNGMAFDAEGARAHAITLEVRRAELQAQIVRVFEIYLPSVTYNPCSREQLSAVLFGGSMGVVEDVIVRTDEGEPLTYKSGLRKGEPKTRKERVAVWVDGMSVRPSSSWKTSKEGVYQVHEDVLEKLKDDTRAGALVRLVLAFRELEKDISTYYRGYSDLVWQDGCIHPSLEHVSTATGRLSCTKPNLQNTSTGD